MYINYIKHFFLSLNCMLPQNSATWKLVILYAGPSLFLPGELCAIIYFNMILAIDFLLRIGHTMLNNVY